MATGLASSAHAEEGPRGGILGNYTGANVSRSGEGLELSAQAKEKLALIDGFTAAEEGRISKADYFQREARYLRKYKIAKRSGGLRSGAFAPSSRTLPLTHYGQINGYFCGPATGLMVVKMADGSIRSKYNRNAFSQSSMGNSAHMDTARAGRTDWAAKQFVRGVNRWRGEPYYVQVPRPTASRAMSALKHDIGNNSVPIAADTVEFAGGLHYNGHPRHLTIGHWIAAYGYTNGGASSKWADPSTTIWSSARPTFNQNTSYFVNTHLQTNGYAV
ncbi:hypothetical protein ACWCQL_37040 [Streptomyces sp. NPDC002073]